MAEDQNENKIVVSDEDADKLLNDGTGPQDDSNDSNDDSDDGPGKGADDKKPDADDQVDKWKRMSRKNEKDLRAAQARLKELEDKDKSESDKLLEARDTFKSQAEKSTSELNRYRIAMDAAPEGPIDRTALAKVLKRLRGDTDEALEEDAKELWGDFAPASSGSSVAGKPKEKLDRPRGGGNPDDEPDEMNPAKLAALIPRAR